jgi:hypothetical protein
VGVETPRLRIGVETTKAFKVGNEPEVFRTAEPALVAFLQELRRHLGEDGKGPWNVPRLWIDDAAESLALPDVVPATYELTQIDRALNPDKPGEPSPAPLAPDLEKEFGRWATWRELPRFKND